MWNKVLLAPENSKVPRAKDIPKFSDIVEPPRNSIIERCELQIWRCLLHKVPSNFLQKIRIWPLGVSEIWFSEVRSQNSTYGIPVSGILVCEIPTSEFWYVILQRTRKAHVSQLLYNSFRITHFFLELILIIFMFNSTNWTQNWSEKYLYTNIILSIPALFMVHLMKRKKNE